jgi:hypothetical protein
LKATPSGFPPPLWCGTARYSKRRPAANFSGQRSSMIVSTPEQLKALEDAAKAQDFSGERKIKR